MTFATPLFDPAVHVGPARMPEEKPYVYRDPQVVIAVNVALATGRPLLVSGLPGSGKSSLAQDVARRLERSFIGTVITSRTRLEDLVAEIDLVRRLSHAEQDRLGEDRDYLVPGVLWWAIDPSSALDAPAARGRDERRRPERAGNGIVVLLDEIDKAEPDLPNDLLGPLGELSISVPFLGERRADPKRVLVVLTTNGERDMPPAFLRRCLHLELRPPGADFLVEVATAHHGPDAGTLYRDVAVAMRPIRRAAHDGGRRVPSTAEYLDTVAACLEFGEYPGSALWQEITTVALTKHQDIPDEDDPDDPDGGGGGGNG